ncbi:chromate transporter [Halalkalibacillus sediminis]|uniref:Chromate transporter n=1 Tax=Halalkalibacillus sediminis TaxID=2018042 RepID=A0A2I0QU59_9BACI|nr:chromate transporter [Halalkalibacillus sediminis]PKR77883.1 chromate transporter [Halalkalibacillus sediminis]
MNFSLQKDLFISFFRAGMLGYGGGPSTIPLVHKEVVDTYKWMTEEEFGDVLAIGNTLPGPIMTKMAGYIGYQVGGVAGLISAMLATVIPTVLLMIALISFLFSFRDSPIVQGMTNAVSPVVGVMLLLLTYSFIKNSKRDLGWVLASVLGLISVITYVWLDLHPAILIGVLIVIALIPRRNKGDSDE